MARRTRMGVDADTRVLNNIVRNHKGNVAGEVRRAAFAIEGRAKINAPVDTGALRASIHVSLQEESPPVQQRPDVQYVELPRPRDNHTAHVGPSVEYGAAVELGTHNRSGRPYLLPALRAVEDEYRRGLGKAVSNGK